VDKGQDHSMVVKDPSLPSRRRVAGFRWMINWLRLTDPQHTTILTSSWCSMLFGEKQTSNLAALLRNDDDPSHAYGRFPGDQ